jgi:hypothetical protein
MATTSSCVPVCDLQPGRCCFAPENPDACGNAPLVGHPRDPRDPRSPASALWPRLHRRTAHGARPLPQQQTYRKHRASPAGAIALGRACRSNRTAQFCDRRANRGLNQHPQRKDECGRRSPANKRVRRQRECGDAASVSKHPSDRDWRRSARCGLRRHPATAAPAARGGGAARRDLLRIFASLATGRGRAGVGPVFWVRQRRHAYPHKRLRRRECAGTRPARHQNPQAIRPPPRPRATP